MAVNLNIGERETQKEAKALGDPTRYRIFSYISHSDWPVTVGELTKYVKLNHNAVRQHLAILKNAGLVVEALEARDTPGRPRLLYSKNPDIVGSWGTFGHYSWLAQMLSTVISTRQTPREVGYGEGLGILSRAKGSSNPLDLFEVEMRLRGFRPERLSKRGDKIEFVLGRCPFAQVAETDPSTICQLHLGLAQGMAESTGTFKVDKLVLKNPAKAGCRLILQEIHRKSQSGD